MNEKSPQDQIEPSADKSGTSKKSDGNPMDMGMNMMRKMMGKDGSNPMDMKQKMMGKKEAGAKDDGKPMQQMMGMCKNMLHTMQHTTTLAVYAQPELQKLFEEWLTAQEAEVLKLLEESGGSDPETLATALSMTPESATALLARLQNIGKIQLHAELRKPSKQTI